MKKYLLILGLFIFASATTQAQKFAYVDMEYVLNKMPQYEAAQNKVDKLAEEWKKEIDSKYKDIQSAYRKFQEEERFLLSDEMQSKRIEEIENMEREVKQYQNQKFGYEGEMYQKREELVRPIQDRVYEAIETVAANGGYDFIFDKSAGTAILFASPRRDKSDDVLNELGL